MLNSHNPVRLAPLTLNGVGPVLQVGGGGQTEYVTTPFVAYGFEQGAPLPEGMKGTWRRTVVCAGNVVSLALSYHDKKKRYQLVAFGDFVKDFESTKWAHGVIWCSDDGQKWGHPTMMYRMEQAKARPQWVGCSVATLLEDASADGISAARPFILPFDGVQYDTRYPDPGYCRYLSAFFADNTLKVSKGEDGKPDGNNKAEFTLQWPERQVGNGLVPLPAVEQKYSIIRYEKDGKPRVRVDGPLIPNLFDDRNSCQVFPVALGVCLNPELLEQDGVGSWEFRTLPPKRLRKIDQLTVDNIADEIDEGGEDEDSAEHSEAHQAELEAATAGAEG